MSQNEGPIRTQKLHEQVAERLQAMILERQMQPGDRLPSERELQAMYGIGRPAVREALLLLERSGLIALRRGNPAMVISANPESIIREMQPSVAHFLADPNGVKQLQAARKLLECAIARQAAKMRTEEDLAKMWDALERSREYLDDTAVFETIDLEFHAAIVGVLKNSVFDVAFQAMNEWLKGQRTIALALPGQTDFTLENHTAIYNAIAAGDADGAENAMNFHLSHVEKTYWAVREMELRREAGQLRGTPA